MKYAEMQGGTDCNPEWKIPPEGEWLTAEDARRALCGLTEEVLSALAGAPCTDCFCGFGGFQGGDGTLKHRTAKDGYRNDGRVIRFIIKATRDALEPIKQRRAEIDTQIARLENERENLG